MEGYELAVSRGVALDGPTHFDNYEGRLFLDFIKDDVVETLESYAEAATEILNDNNALGIIRRDTRWLQCQDWCLLILQSLEDAQCLERGTLNKAQRCPRRDLDADWDADEEVWRTGVKSLLVSHPGSPHQYPPSPSPYSLLHEH
jgi:hypothetical protein